MTTTRRTFLHQSGLAAGTMLFASGDGFVRAADAQPRRLNPWRLEPVDLRRFMQLGIEHIYHGAIDRRRGCLPFVRFNLTAPPTWCNHEYWGSPHMVGRFLDALALCAEIVDVPEDEEAINGLRKLLHDCLDNPSGLPFDTLPSPDGKMTATMHHCREVLLALVGLGRWRKCERSVALARKLVRTIERVTRETGSFPSQAYRAEGWVKPEPNILNTTSGRLIGALVAYHQAMRDDLAVDVAKRLADANIAQTFTPDGELTKAAGTHMHSTEGTMAGLLYLGELTGEKRYAQIGRALYDNGLKRWRTSWGWAKESRRHSPGRGEANNTGDFIESALVLARRTDLAYFADAERFVRNGLLASQVVATDWIRQSGKRDGENEVHSDLRRRARGAFAFTTPNGYHSYNTDLMGGSLRALCKTYQAIVTSDGDTCRLNMRFGVESPWVTVRSSLPERGCLEVRTHRACTVSVHLPEGVAAGTARATIDGKARPVTLRTGELSVGKMPANATAVFAFELPRRHTRERAPGWKPEFEIDWSADTIVAMEPSQGPIALY